MLFRSRVTARTLVFVSQIKIAKAGEFNLLTIFQSTTDLFEKQLYQLFGIPFAKPPLLMPRAFASIGLIHISCRQAAFSTSTLP